MYLHAKQIDTIAARIGKERATCLPHIRTDFPCGTAPEVTSQRNWKTAAEGSIPLKGPSAADNQVGQGINKQDKGTKEHN